MLKSIYIILLICVPIKLYSQCVELNRLKQGGSFGSVDYNSETFVISYKYLLTGNNPVPLQNDINKILNSAKEYIIKRGGKIFFKQIKFVNLRIIYHHYSQIKNFTQKQYQLEKCGKVTIWISCVFNPFGNVKYNFSLMLDKSGRLISDHQFPNIRKNSNFYNIMQLCEAVKIAKTFPDITIIPIMSLQLSYLEDENTFCWIIVEDYRSQVREETGIKTYKATSGGYKVNRLYLNAVTGELIKKDYEYGIVTR